MFCKSLFSVISLTLFVFIGNIAFAGYPSADANGDCFVDLEDFVLMANQWLTGDPNIPEDMVFIPNGGFEMGDHFEEGNSDELPLHPVLLDPFFMGKYEVTNDQYCEFLNSAFGTGVYFSSGIVYGTGNNEPYCDTSASHSDSQIDYSGGVFSVRTKGGRDMSNDPMVQVTWYGSVAYCNWRSSAEGYESCYNFSTWDCDFSKNGYRLPTEAEWEYAARGGLSGKRFPWSDPNISHSEANYYADPNYSYDVSPTEGYHPDWNDGIWPYTAPVGSFPANGYGLYDMVGNVAEWCNDWSDENYYETSPYNNPIGPISGVSFRVIRVGNWAVDTFYCRVTRRGLGRADDRGSNAGFRIVLKTE